jgi:hypothetical protein
LLIEGAHLGQDSMTNASARQVQVFITRIVVVPQAILIAVGACFRPGKWQQGADQSLISVPNTPKAAKAGASGHIEEHGFQMVVPSVCRCDHQTVKGGRRLMKESSTSFSPSFFETNSTFSCNFRNICLSQKEWHVTVVAHVLAFRRFLVGLRALAMMQMRGRDI